MAEFKTPNAKRRVSRGEGSTGTPKIVIPPSPLMKQLGYGTGVKVYLMERFSPIHGSYKSPWAVKKINRVIKDEGGEYSRRLNVEANLLKTLNHPNIIGYRSYTEKDGDPCLAMESGDHSLEKLIEKREEECLGPFIPSQILKVAKDVARGLQYLHEQKRLLHGDLKSANILIQGDFKTAKLCDFGVSLKLDQKGVMCDPDQQCYIGTECWSAPEVLDEDVITQKTDIFSFGLVLWEMLALQTPHIDKLDLSSDDLSESLQEDEFQKFLGTRPSLPDTPLTENYLPVLEIFYACTEAEPAKRPTASQILYILDGLMDEKGNTKGIGGDRKFLEMLHEDL